MSIHNDIRQDMMENIHPYGQENFTTYIFGDVIHVLRNQNNIKKETYNTSDYSFKI